MIAVKKEFNNLKVEVAEQKAINQEQAKENEGSLEAYTAVHED